MDASSTLAEHFEAQRGRLRGIAYRMLGSIPEADDAVQDAWLRISRAGADDVENLNGWFTTIVARVCLNTLRARNVRKEETYGVHLPDPIISFDDRESQPENEVLLADSVGLALLVVLDTLSPAERLAFVLHDMFGFPFDEIATLLDRTPAATRQLASRARRTVRGAALQPPDTDIARQRPVVDAFFQAARAGDFDGLVAILNPDVVLRADFGVGGKMPSFEKRGADAVASQALFYTNPVADLQPVLVNGSAGVVVFLNESPVAIMGFTIANDKIVAIDSIADRSRVERIMSYVFDNQSPPV